MDRSSPAAAERRCRAVANPYLKVKAKASTNGKTMIVTPIAGGGARRPVATPANDSRRRIVGRANGTSPIPATARTATPNQPAWRARNAYETGTATAGAAGVDNRAVTPTPKKKGGRQHRQAAAAMSGASYAGKPVVRGRPSVDPSANRVSPPSARPPCHRPNNAAVAAKVPPAGKKPKTLKSQLKSQIAELHRRKRQFLQKKEDEKRRLLQQKERERIRKEREEDLRRKRELREEERQMREAEVRRARVGKCIDSMVKGVERKMELERKNRGVHYSIGQVMESMICTVKDRDEKRKSEERRCTYGANSQVADNHWATAGINAARPSANYLQHVHANNAVHPSSHPYNSASTSPHMHPMLMHNPHLTFNPNLPTDSHANNMNAVLRSILASMESQSASAPPAIVAQQPCNKPSKPSAKPTAPLVLHPSPITDPYSPFTKTHHAVPTEISITKKAPGDSFGVVLRWECKGALVPLPVPADAANIVAGGGVPVSPTKKAPRRKRVTFGVMAVVNVDRATHEGLETLHPGDLILTINGNDVGGWTFSEACRAIGASAACSATSGAIRCVLKVARRNSAVPKVTSAIVEKSVSPPGNPSGSLIDAKPIIVPTPPPMIPFNTSAGEFTSVEWGALVQGLTTIPHHLFSGTALVPVSRAKLLKAIQKSEKYGPPLRRRSVEALGMKLEYESNRILMEMENRAKRYWTYQFIMCPDDAALPTIDTSVGVPMMMTDAQRSGLRHSSRPTSGCKCGMSDHEFVNDPKCPLYDDIRRYCVKNSIQVQNDGDDGEKRRKRKRLTNAKKMESGRAVERAQVDRFSRIRAETDATKREAEFVTEMEKIQSSKMKKAVFAPSLLCTLVLSAVASLTDRITVPEKEGLPQAASDDSKLVDGKSSADGDGSLSTREGIKMEISKSDSEDDSDDGDSDSDESDDEDVPLNSLLHQKERPKRPASAMKPSNSAPPSKWSKQMMPETNPIPASGTKAQSGAAPSPYFLAEILKHVSQTHGHLFEEPSHADFAWQQRHRSTLTSQLPKEIMFKGNPRTPGSLSFEKIRFVLDEERMSRLRDVWRYSKQQTMQQPSPRLNSTQEQPADKETIERWNDEWIVAHLSSDAVTGLCHEINVLVSLGILSIEANGAVALKGGWERRAPQIVLNEMRDAWGSPADVHDLFCIHDRIKSSLECRWDYIDDGWRFLPSLPSKHDDCNAIDNDGFVFDNEEYRLREQIFTENYFAWVNERSGMGEFGL